MMRLSKCGKCGALHKYDDGRQGGIYCDALGIDDCPACEAKDRPEWVHCIKHTHEEKKHTTWCGREHVMEFLYQNVDHAAYSVMNGDRIQPCHACVEAVTAMLAKSVAP